MSMRAPAPVLAAMLMLFASGPSLAAEKSPEEVKLDSGGRTFARYCALCHGIDGAGYGPLAESLAAAPPDLTELTEDNKGTFPEERVRNVIENGGPKGHGMMAMLAWGKVFNEELGGDSHKIIDELTAYIKSLQGR